MRNTQRCGHAHLRVHVCIRLTGLGPCAAAFASMYTGVCHVAPVLGLARSHRLRWGHQLRYSRMRAARNPVSREQQGHHWEITSAKPQCSCLTHTEQDSCEPCALQGERVMMRSLRVRCVCAPQCGSPSPCPLPHLLLQHTQGKGHSTIHVMMSAHTGVHTVCVCVKSDSTCLLKLTPMSLKKAIV